MRIKLNEHGRSMVEILGVLAIIGILSIGGMAGYQYAYSSYQAGQIQDVVSKAKLLATQNNRSSHVKEVRRFVENMLSKYKPADTTPMVTHRDGKYIVDLFNISDSVCEKLQNRRDIFNSMRIGMIPKACTTAEMNMQFTFDSIVIGGSSVNGSGDSYDNPIERCPDKQVWRQKEDGTYGCVCRHAYEYGEDCTRCEPPRSWNQGNQSCQCPANRPIWEYGVCKCITDTDCQYSGTGFCCDDTEQVCRPCDETDCDKTKGLTLADGRCVCSGRKEWRQDEGDSEPSCKCPVNTPTEANPKTCECPDGKDNVDEDGDGINECVTSCPSDTGFTGLRNRTTGNCLCDTGAGYKAESETINGIQTCLCDEANNYYNAQGKCSKCVPVDDAWVQQQKDMLIRGEMTDFNSITYTDSDNPTVWNCNVLTYGPVAGQHVFNPSTNKICNLNDVLIKGSDGNFKCSDHCHKNNLGDGSERRTPWGYCACRFNRTWNTTTKTCVSPCASGHYRNGKCDPCGPNNWTFDGKTCKGPSCNGVTAWTKGSENFQYATWLDKTPISCHPNATDGKSGRAIQTESGDCSYKYGCTLFDYPIPSCTIGITITSDCECASGDKTGICCSSTTYPTSTGCASCPAGQVPNSSRTGCESCPKNTITKDGKCIKCDAGYYPSNQQNRCLACPSDRTTDEDGLTCSVCIDSNKIFNMITNTCECPPEISFEDPVNGNCILLEDEIPENMEE
ncbi:MAG: hypothetical protein E7014_03565 [Alphaproteobacteria bacterium]|nr:hypothetical protein [Alphaproteobacteria bacterium]